MHSAFPIKALAAFSGSGVGTSETYKVCAMRIGTLMAQHGLHLICGGGNDGLMGILANAVLDNGGTVTGIVPDEMVGMEIPNPRLTTLLTVGTINERKSLLQQMSDGFLILPGGVGTMDEFFQVFSTAKLGIHQKPIGVLNIDNFYTPLIHLMSNMVDQRFMKSKHSELVYFDSDPVRLLERTARLV